MIHQIHYSTTLFRYGPDLIGISVRKSSYSPVQSINQDAVSMIPFYSRGYTCLSESSFFLMDLLDLTIRSEVWTPFPHNKPCSATQMYSVRSKQDENNGTNNGSLILLEGRPFVKKP